MKNQFLSFLFVAMALLMVSCGGSDNPGGQTDVTIQLSQSAFSVPVDGGTYTVNVTCSGREWTASSSDRSWLNVQIQGSTQQSGTVTITVDANQDTAERQGTVVVRSGSTSQSISISQAAAAAPEIVAPAGYTLVWHDEFNAGDKPSTSATGWNYETGHGDNGWGNNEIQTYVSGSNHPDVCFIKDGILNIKMQKVGSEVQSIRMNTNQSWQYGYFEARLRLPAGKGTWPAFWMMPKNFTSWPGDGEIDIMEEVGYNPNYIQSTIHCNKYNNGGTSIEGSGKSVPTAQSAFHTYACEWTSTYLRFYIDGDAFFTYRNDGTGHDAWPFDAPFYLKLNLAWGGNWGGAQGIDESALPATYQIDYVRVFQKK